MKTHESGKLYSIHYSDGSFWKKLRGQFRRIGRPVVHKALELYYVLKSPNLPNKVRFTIIGALGYFIFPLDVVPDILPMIGYSDDLGALVAALAVAAAYITPEIKAQAARMTDQLFGPDPRLIEEAGDQ